MDQVMPPGSAVIDMLEGAEEFADWLAQQPAREDRWQAEAIRARDTTAIDPAYLARRRKDWKRAAAEGV